MLAGLLFVMWHASTPWGRKSGERLLVLQLHHGKDIHGMGHYVYQGVGHTTQLLLVPLRASARSLRRAASELAMIVCF